LTCKRSLVQIQYRPPSTKGQRFETGDLPQILSLLLSSNPNITKQLRLRNLDKSTLFSTYLDELRLRQLSPAYITSIKELLTKFQAFIGEAELSPELAQTFLSRYLNHSARTLQAYYGYIKGFLSWYGITLDLKIKAPSYVPPYYTESQVDKLIEASKHKRTHKKLASRDIMLIELAITSGMRRAELSSLKVRDLDLENKRVQITGKGNKKRTIPLMNGTNEKLKRFCKDKRPNDSLFGLKPACISMKICALSKKAGVDLHTHSLRHYFGTRLVEKGANIRAVQELMGHSSLNTTQVYVGVTAKHLEEAVGLLETDTGSGVS